VPPPTVVVPPAPTPVPVPPPVVAPAMPLPFFDGFDGSGGLAAGWSVQVGGFTRSGGAAVSAAGVSIATLRGATVADSVQRASVNLRRGQSIGLVARYAGHGDQSMYVAELARVGRGYVVQIFRHFGGTWTLLAKQRVSGSRGELRFDVVGSQLTARFNGRLAAQAVDQQITAAGSVGLRTVGVGGRVETYAVA